MIPFDTIFAKHPATSIRSVYAKVVENTTEFKDGLAYSDIPAIHNSVDEACFMRAFKAGDGLCIVYDFSATSFSDKEIRKWFELVDMYGLFPSYLNIDFSIKHKYVYVYTKKHARPYTYVFLCLVRMLVEFPSVVNTTLLSCSYGLDFVTSLVIAHEYYCQEFLHTFIPKSFSHYPELISWKAIKVDINTIVDMYKGFKELLTIKNNLTYATTYTASRVFNVHFGGKYKELFTVDKLFTEYYANKLRNYLTKEL